MSEINTTILVVDDEEYTRQLLQLILEDAHYRVVSASSGNEAVDKVSSNNINLVLLDIRMPGMDGFQTLELIRKKSAVPVIMVTGMGEMSSQNNSLNLGANDYVKKPFRSAELLERIETRLKRD